MWDQCVTRRFLQRLWCTCKQQALHLGHPLKCFNTKAALRVVWQTDLDMLFWCTLLFLVLCSCFSALTDYINVTFWDFFFIHMFLAQVQNTVKRSNTVVFCLHAKWMWYSLPLIAYGNTYSAFWQSAATPKVCDMYSCMRKYTIYNSSMRLGRQWSIWHVKCFPPCSTN